MSELGLTSNELRQKYSAEIIKGETFKTFGVSKQEALGYLETPEGEKYFQHLKNADPKVQLETIIDRAVQQLTSGRELPRMEIINESLVKLTPIGTDVSPYSPYFARRSTVDDGLASGKSLHDYFGLPGKSEAARYRMDEVRPLAPTEAFISEVAPTSELGGQVTRAGGAEQVLVPNRKLYTEPTYLRNIDNSLALQTERRVGVAVKGVTSVGAGVAMAYDGYTTAEKYQALSAQGNDFGADALLRRYEGRTAGGVLGSMAAGATYGFVGGSETGPGAFLTGAAGGVIGAFAGEEIAKAINEHKINYQTGSDGVTYAYENGQWGRTQHHVDLNSTGVTNPYNAPNYTSTTTPAPDDQIGQLEYQRMSAVIAVSLANPATQDTKHIDLDGTKWHATREGWAQQVEMPGVPNSYGIPSSIAVDKPADAKTSEQLNQLAANRQFNNDHYAKEVSNGYVMDYYGKGWAANGALPDVVTKPLGLPSEQHIKDPVTGNVWDASKDGHFTRENNHLVGRVFVRETVQASGAELDRLVQHQQTAIDSNTAYGKQLIAQNFERSDGAQQSARAARMDAELPAATDPFLQREASGASPTPLATAEDSTVSKVVPAITPQSSNREMFNAMMTAAQNLDIDAMRSLSQNYLQSPQGQAWLEQGQQFNQQQAAVQQQAAMDAQQQSQAVLQGPMR